MNTMKAVIMAGGKGTRLSAIAKDIPKPMVEIDGRPILEHQIYNLIHYGITDIIIIVGHYGDVIKEYFNDGKAYGANISYINEKFPMGTAGALFFLKDVIDDDFLLIFGDVFINIDFQRMICYHKEKKSKITLFVHPNSHPYDSDLVQIDEDSRVVEWLYKNIERSNNYANIVNAGIYLVSQDVLDSITEIKKIDFEKDIVVPCVKQHERIFAYKSTEYAKDMGTPERYNDVIEDYLNGVCNSRNLSNKQKCIFLDRDGTINVLNGFISQCEDMHLLSNVTKAIKMINMSGFLCIVVTNQPVIARGESSINKLNQIHSKMETLLGMEGSYIDDLYYCPHHPDAGFEGEVVDLKIECECRKPKIGLLIQATQKYNIDLSQSWMIGDTTSDIQTGKNAGMNTGLVLTGEGGRDMKYNAEADIIGNDLLECICKILKPGDTKYD